MKVCIIGAGPSGIAAAKTLKAHNVEFDCFEKGSKIGGVWRYENDNNMSSCYRSLHINTNRNIMAYSDFPMPAHYPMFPHHSQIIKYFDDYCAHFQILAHIHFQTTVEEIKRNADGTFTVFTDKLPPQIYRAVIVANGHHWNPRYPEPSFAGNFTGETMHAHYYRTPDVLENKNVLVVGIGNSAVDIACEAAHLHTGKVTISTRSGAHIMPNWFWGLPFDSLASPLTAKLPLFLQRWLLSSSLFLARGVQSWYGMPTPKRSLLHEHPTVSQELLNLVGRGLIHIKPNIQSLEGKTVHFTDGTQETVDLLIYATGYKVSFPFFKEGFFNVESNNDIQLYQRVAHPDIKNLFFLGLIQPLGAIMPLSEVQAIWVAKILSGQCQLPESKKMHEAIEKMKIATQKRYGTHSPRHTLQVDFYPYKESLEKEMRKMRIK